MTTIGVVCGDPTPIKALNEFSASQSWKVHMKERDLLEEISSGPPQEVEGGREESSQGGGSRRSRDRSCDTVAQHNDSPHHGQHEHNNVALDAMSRALRRAAQSPFSEEIECTKMSR
nr:hypothetical protein CFP56_49940 [Quercus suber]POF22835.1 hypothetical protein CFP56_33986 [Quercus suber]